MQMRINKELSVEYPESEDDSTPNGNSRDFDMKHESNLETRGDLFFTLDGAHMTVMTRG